MADDSVAAKVNRALSPLIGLRLEKIAFAAMFRMFHFASRQIDGSIEDAHSIWALHVDCPWRLDLNDAVLVGSDDWSERADGTTPSEDWSPQSGGSLQEAVLRSVLQDPECGERLPLRNRTDGLVVETVLADTWGGCVIVMSPGYRLTLFPNSVAHECWRIFKRGTPSHFVIPLHPPGGPSQS
jgi:hypothetical protein